MSTRALTVFDRSVGELAAEFNYITPLSRIEIPVALHRQFAAMHSRSYGLQRKLAMVMDDGEHRLLLQEGRLRTAFNLPHEDFLRPENEALHDILRSFNPYRSTGRNRGYVSLETGQVEGFFKVFAATHSIVHDVFSMFRETDYLKYQRHLQERGVKYAGPTSLQEIVSAYVSLGRTHKMQTAYMEELAMNRNL